MIKGVISTKIHVLDCARLAEENPIISAKSVFSYIQLHPEKEQQPIVQNT